MSLSQEYVAEEKKERKRKKKSHYSLCPYIWNKENNIANTAFASLSRDRIALPFFSIRLLRSRKTAWIKKDLCWASAACMLLIRHSFGHRSNNCELATVTNQWRDACTQKTVWRGKTRFSLVISSGCGNHKGLTQFSWQSLFFPSSLKKKKGDSTRRVTQGYYVYCGHPSQADQEV